MTTRTWSDRLALAERLIDVEQGGSELPGWLEDQVDTATRNTLALLDRLAVELPIADPDRGWHQCATDRPTRAQQTMILAALLDVRHVCAHLRRGPAPALVSLALRRADCHDCAGTIRRPPADEDDRCDVCGVHGVVMFMPITVVTGPVMVVGDACGDCADFLMADLVARSADLVARGAA